MRFFIVVLSLLLVSCSGYRALPTDPRNNLKADISKPRTQEARNTAPRFVTSSAPTKDIDNPATTSSAKSVQPVSVPSHADQTTVTDPKPTQDDTPAVLIIEQESSEESNTEMAPRPASVVSAGSSREREHLSFTSYNPFSDGNTFMVDLDAEAANAHYPIDGHLLSPYGSRGRGFHSGSDIKGEYGDPIYAVFDGEVRLSRSYGGYGNVIAIRHANGLETAYSHNSKNLVEVGDQVKAGQKIALCGRTGRATGTHCHFEVRILGKTINPALLLNFNRRTLQSGILIVKRNSSNAVTASLKGDGTPDVVRATPAQPSSSAPSQTTASTAATTTANNTATAKQSTSSATSSSTSSSSSTAKYHTVKQGDTLYGIAKKYGTSVKKICQLNKLDEKKYLQLKQKLRIN